MSAVSSHPRGARLGRALLSVYVLLAVVFLLAPIVAITAGSLTTTSYVVFPPKGLTLNWYLQVLNQAQFIRAFGLSLVVAAVAGTVSTGLGLLCGLALVRHTTRLNTLLRILVTTPVMLPSMFLGLALLIMYSRYRLTGTPLGLLCGHIVMVTPFAVSLISIGLASIDPTLERAARSLGATPWQALRRVTLPLIAWSLLAGWGIGFMISFGSLEISLFLSTSTMVTLPVQIYSALEWSPLDPVLTAASSGLVIVTLVVLLGLGRFAHIDRLLTRQ